MRLAALALPLLLATALLTISPRAFAQASDADRAAARELFNKGVELQNQQKFADALDHFERSQKVVNAPTIYLHVGQCQAALGRLVEATEAFRQAINFPLPANPPAPFVAAQNEATTQLASISPRIPELKITVQPKDIPTLSITVDDQPVNSALVGVSRPTNPGTHKVTASAPGYTKAERTVDLKEKQKLEVTLSLVSTGGVVYGTGTGDTGVTVQPAGSASAAPTSTMPPPPPPPRDPRSKMGIFLGLRLGVSALAGSLPNGDTAQSTTSIGDVAGPGGQLGIEAAFRFIRILYISVTGDVAGYSGKDLGAGVTTSMTSGLVAGHFGILTNPDGLAFFGDIGAGYRYVDLTGTPSNGGPSADVNFSGEDFILRLGIHLKAGKYVRIIPQTEIDFGTLGTNGSVPTSGTLAGATGGSDSTQTAGHVAFFFGVGGYFDIDLDKPKPAAPAPASSSAAPAADASGSAGVTVSSPTTGK
ncbi:MAG: PEGA domain-containing protein [Polyangiaceae bacterium]